MTRAAPTAATPWSPGELAARLLGEVRRGAALADSDFDAIFPAWVRRLSEHHWTPFEVCIRAAELLAGDGARTILDVGAGAGKLCLVGAARTGATFVGVEQRPRLVEVARELARAGGLDNAEFIHGNAMTLDWGRFDGFYLFNPFYEHIVDYQPRIDEPIIVSPDLFTNYVVTTCVKLCLLPAGARVVAYHGFGAPMPRGFRRRLREPAGSEFLELWQKVT